MAAEHVFKAMGTEAHVLVVGHTDNEEGRLLDYARERIERLEAKWSRFRPTSELRRLNAAAGRPVVVSQDTFNVVAHAVDGWYLTAGRYDPTILDALIAAGYDRTFDELDRPPAPTQPAQRAPGCAEIIMSQSVNTITLPRGVQLDLGGIGKGYAADLVTAELLALGARGALVSIGGDIRCAGTAPWDVGWLIEIEDPVDPDVTTARLGLADGAVVTTTPLKRTWKTADDTTAHHLIDPATGLPADTGLSAVTVVAGEAWWAEVLAKAAYLAGPADGVRLLAGLGVTGILFDDQGRAHNVDRLEAFSRQT